MMIIIIIIIIVIIKGIRESTRVYGSEQGYTVLYNGIQCFLLNKIKKYLLLRL